MLTIQIALDFTFRRSTTIFVLLPRATLARLMTICLAAHGFSLRARNYDSCADSLCLFEKDRARTWGRLWQIERAFHIGPQMAELATKSRGRKKPPMALRSMWVFVLAR